VGLGALLDRMRGALGTRAPSASELFRQADRLRHEGRSEEAALLVQEGLRRAPTSSAGHLLAGYLHLGARRVEPARASFRTVLALDPDHPRALLGLARIAIESGDPAAARPFLERALQYHTDFPEARALEDMLASWPSDAGDTAAVAETAPARTGVALPEGARDAILARLDGTVLFTQWKAGQGAAEGEPSGADDARQAMLAQHVVQVARIATATLVRAGLGALHRGVIDGARESTYLQADAGLVLAVSLPAGTGVEHGLDCLGTLWADTVPAHD
jgi:tetratricopeptide (TPR) repeat protein